MTSRGPIHHEQDVRVRRGVARLTFRDDPNLVPVALDAFECIGPFHAAKLASINIRDNADLLRLCADAKGRGVVSGSTGLRRESLLEWARVADLTTVPGITPPLAALLMACQVTTIDDLRRHTAPALEAKLQRASASLGAVDIVPRPDEIDRWIAHAREYEGAVTV